MLPPIELLDCRESRITCQPPHPCPPAPQNVVFALSNAATKGSTAGRKAITVLGLDRLQPRDSWAVAGGANSFRRRLQRWESEAASAGALGSGATGAAAASSSHGGGVLFSPRDSSFDGPQPAGDGGVLGAMLEGVVGLAAEPIRGLDESEHCAP